MSTADIIFCMVISLVITLAFELLFSFLCRIRGRLLIIVTAVNLLTNPIVTFCYYIISHYTSISSILIKLVLELGAMTCEWLIYRHYAKEIKHPLFFSIAANCISFFGGALINFIL